MNADRYGIGDARIYERRASMERAQELRRRVLEVAAGVLFAAVLFIVSAAPWDQLQ